MGLQEILKLSSLSHRDINVKNIQDTQFKFSVCQAIIIIKLNCYESKNLPLVLEQTVRSSYH